MSRIVSSLASQGLPDDVRTVHDFWNPTVTSGRCAGGLPDYVREIIERRDDEFDDAPLAELRIEVPQPIVGDAPSVRADARMDDGHADRSWPQSVGYRDFAEIPSRKILLDRPPGQAKGTSLPNFVSVIDIDHLPALLADM